MVCYKPSQGDIQNSRETPVEEFHFRFKVDQNKNETLSSKDLCLSQIEESLCGLLLRLSDVNLYLKPLDSREDWSFEIAGSHAGSGISLLKGSLIRGFNGLSEVIFEHI